MINTLVKGSTRKINFFTAINEALTIALREDKSAILFGEDVSFGGVFRCSINLKDQFGSDRFHKLTNIRLHESLIETIHYY